MSNDLPILTDDQEAKKEILSRLGVDLMTLLSLPPGGGGREWPAAFGASAETMYLNGFLPRDIHKALSIPESTVSDWANRYGWLAKRDAHQRKLAEQALAISADGQIDIINRHLKALRTAQNAAMMAIVGKKVDAKSLEGIITSLILSVRAEREVLGISQPEGAIQDNRVQTYVNQLNLSPEQRDEFFQLQREKFELDEKINALNIKQAGESTETKEVLHVPDQTHPPAAPETN